MPVKDDKYIPITNMDDEEVVKHASSLFKRAWSDKANDFTRNDRYRNILMALDNPDDIIDETTGKMTEDRGLYSNTYIPFGAAIADTAQTVIFNHLFPTPDYFKMDGKEFEDDFMASKITAHMKDRHIQMGFRSSVLECVQQMVCFDYCAAFMRWNIQAGKVPVYNKNIDPYELDNVDVKRHDVSVQWEDSVCAIDRPELEVIPFFNCLHDSNCNSSTGSIKDSTFFFDWREESFGRLVKYSKAEDREWGQYVNVDKLISNHWANIEKHQSTSSAKRHTGPDPERITVIRLWTPDEIIEYSDDVLIRRQKIDGIPIVIFKLFDRPGEFPGMGVLQRIERMQYDINTAINLKRDFQNLQLTPIAAIDSKLLSNEEGDVALYPGKTFRFRGGDARQKIHFYQPGFDISQGTSEEIGIQTDAMERVTGFAGSPNVQGSFSKGRTTAREVSAVAAGVISKANLYSKRTERDCLIPLYEQQFRLEQVNLRRADAFKWIGKDGIQWPLIVGSDYAFRRMPRFTATGAEFASQNDLKIERFFKAIQVVSQLAPNMLRNENVAAKVFQMLDPEDFQYMVKDPREKTHNVPAAMENYIMAQGGVVEVSPENNHQQHDAMHEAYKRTADYQSWPPNHKLRMDQHQQQHKQAEGAGLAQGQAGLDMLRSDGEQDPSDLQRGQRSLGAGNAIG